MRNLLIEAAGILALAVSLGHGVIGETKIFPRAKIEPARLRLLMRLIWQAGTVAWISLAILLIASPRLGAEARSWIVMMSIVTFGVAAIANAWASRGRHVGWIAMTIVVGLAAIGL